MSESTLVDEPRRASANDRELVGQYLDRRDQESFARIVERYRGLVMGTCRRILRNAADAEDAFQATFLVLAKRAAELRGQASIAGWLHETARRISLKSLQARARTERRNRSAGEERLLQSHAAPSIEDVAAIVDEELARLPEKFREPLALTLFEELSRDETAQRMGLSVAAVKDRLERGRELLRKALTARGVTASAAVAAAWLSAGTASAASATLMTAVVPAAVAFAAGNGSLASISALSLAQGVLNMYALTKVKTLLLTAASLLVVAGVAYGMLVPAPDRFEKGLRGRIEMVDAQSTPPKLVVLPEEFDVKLGLDIDSQAKVHIAYEAGDIASLRKGMFVNLRLGDNHRTVREIHALGTTHRVVIAAVNANFTGEIDDNDDDAAAAKKLDFPLAKDAILTIADLPARPNQFTAGLKARIELGKDGKTVHAIEAQAGDERKLEGRIMEVDAAGNKVKVSVERDDANVELWFKTTADVLVSVDGKTSPLADLRSGAHFRGRLTADAVSFESLAAENREDDDD